MPPYKIRISHMQIYGYYLILMILFFGGFGLFMAHGMNDAEQDSVLFAVTYMSLFGALMFTGCTSLFFKSNISTEGVVYRNLFMKEETLGWNEIDDVRSQITLPYYILRKQLPEGISVKFEEINHVIGSKVCCLPKLAFVKDPDEFTAYLDKVLPPDHKLRSYYF